MVLMGASGDLSKRMVVPALFRLSRRGILPAATVKVDPDAEVGGESKKARLRNAVKPKRGR